MRIHTQIIAILMAAVLISCEKNENEGMENIDVESYIKLLKANQYDYMELPAFEPTDIPALLKYRNETQLIDEFPHNPISSLIGPECKLGMYVLWTIESIRAVSTNSEFLIGRFPSQNPILAKRDSETLELVYDGESHRIAAKAYNDWWENNKHKDYNEFKNIDPLFETEYRWH